MAEGCIIGSVTRKLLDMFWDETLWLPPQIRWSDFNPEEIEALPETKHLAILLPLTTGILILRYLLEKCVFSPLGLALGVDNKSKKKIVPNQLLEKEFRRREKIKHKRIAVLANQLGWSERNVETWFRRRYAQEKSSDLKKFCESCWKCLYYTYSFTFGLICLWDKPWLWDIRQCWTDYPRQSVHTECRWYYISSMAFYISLLVSHYYDVRRKDFWQMCLHHVVTIILLTFSWICNLLRFGTLVLLIHDAADSVLEAAKMAKYANYQRLCNVLFVIFTVTWVVTRLGMYPFWLLYHMSSYASRILLLTPSYIVFNAMLYCLQGLHLYWTVVIFKIAARFVEVGNAESDLRSSSSSSGLESSDDSKQWKAKRKLYSVRKNM